MNKPLLTQLSAKTRKVLAESRALAMFGKMQRAIDKLDEARNQISGAASSPFSNFQIETECVALSLLKVEILHLDFNDVEAFSILRSEVLTKVKFLPNESELVINQNKSEVEISLLTPESSKQLNSSYDERKIADIKFWNPEATVYAFEYAAKGKHYESLPAFWDELKTTYEHGSWFAHRHAARRMAVEWIQLGAADLAVYQAVIAQDVDLIKEIGQHLLLWRDPERIKLTIQKLLSTANLKHHAYLASVFIKIGADAIPDDQLNAVFDWLLIRAELTPKTWNELSLSRAAWEALFEITPRLTAEQGKKIVQTAINHQSWGDPNRLRRDLIRAVNASIPHLQAEELIEVVYKSLPAATNKQEQIDYADALNLVCHIAERSEEAKKIIGDVLYEQPQFKNFELRQLAPVFNRGILADDAEQMAQELAKDIRLQVQHYNEGDSVARPMMILSSFTGHHGDEKVIVHIYVFTPLDGLLVYRKMLSQIAIKDLVHALLDMVEDPENIPANKVGLLKRIVKLADCLTPDLAETLFEKLSSLAEGKELQLPNVLRGFGSPENPLNAFKIDVQKPEDVQAGALYTLAKIEESHPGIYGMRLAPLLEKTMTHPNPIIRRHAFASVRRINVLGDVAITNLFIGTRDPDAVIAARAYCALAENQYLQFSEAGWFSLAHSLALGFNSPNSIVRRDAAFVLAKRQSQWELTSIAEKMQELKVAFANDVCYSVRATVLQKDSN